MFKIDILLLLLINVLLFSLDFLRESGKDPLFRVLGYSIKSCSSESIIHFFFCHLSSVFLFLPDLLLV